MSWWPDALYDTCSIITVDKMLLDDPALARFFPSMATVEPCLAKDNLRVDVADRMRPRVTLVDMPDITEIIRLTAGLPKSLSETDLVLYATAVQAQRAVVTGDTALAKALQKEKIAVGNIATIIKELVESARLTPADCDRILAALDARKDAIIPRPQTWARLKSYKFP